MFYIVGYIDESCYFRVMIRWVGRVWGLVNFVLVGFSYVVCISSFFRGVSKYFFIIRFVWSLLIKGKIYLDELLFSIDLIIVILYEKLMFVWID